MNLDLFFPVACPGDEVQIEMPGLKCGAHTNTAARAVPIPMRFAFDIKLADSDWGNAPPPTPANHPQLNSPALRYGAVVKQQCGQLIAIEARAGNSVRIHMDKWVALEGACACE